MTVKLKSPDTHFIQVDTEFARVYGLNEAVLAGKMLRLQEKLTGETDDAGIKWIRLTLKEWETEVPFLKEMTIRRTIESLEEKGIFLSRTFSGRSKWYRLNPEYVETEHNVSVQNEQKDYDNCAKCTDTTVQNEQLPIVQSYINTTTNVVGGKPPKTEKQKKSQEMFSALTEACQIDLATIRNGTRGKFNQAEKRMRDKGYTPDDIKEFGDWWYLQDWRGKQGQPPTLELIRDCWGQFLRWRKNGKAPRASPNHANDLSSQQLEQIREFNQ